MLPSLDSLSLRELIGQMVVVRACGHLFDRQIQYPQWEASNSQLHSWIAGGQVGGVILLGGSAVEIYQRTRQLQSWATIPLLIAADVEEGVGQRFSGATRFPPPMAWATLDPTFAYDFGRITAQEAAMIGVNWLLAPVADVNSNPQNPVINVRSFGESIPQVCERVGAFIQGAQEYPVLTTAKHFPGHGDTVTDSHLATPILDRSWIELQERELPPFETAIRAGVDSVMTGHLLLPKIDPLYVSTLSEKLIIDLLRQELGFAGLVVTDALIMSGVSDRYPLEEMILQAVRAGNDVLLMPPDPMATIEILVQAVEQGALSYDRIRCSVERIWEAKAKACPDRVLPFPNLDNGAQEKIAVEIAHRSVQVIREGEIPRKIPTSFINLLLVDRLTKATEFIHHQAPAAQILAAQGGSMLVLEFSQLSMLALTTRLPIFVQLFSRGNPFQAEMQMAPIVFDLLQTWQTEQRLLGVVLYGNPFYIPQLRSVLADTIPLVFSCGHHAPCQEAVLEKLFPRSVCTSSEY